MHKVSALLSIFSILMSFVMAYFLISTSLMEENLYGTKRIILITILIAYAIFRSYRLYKSLKKQGDENED